MKNISLLPPEIREEKIARGKKRLVLIISAGILALFAVVYISLLGITISVNSQASALEEQRRSLEEQVGQLEHYADMQERAQEAENVLQQALGESPDWRQLLVNINLSMPGNVWLSDLSASYTNGEGEITIRGWSYKHENVADWLVRIERMEEINDVRCQFSTETAYEGNPAVQFEIRGRVKASQPLEEMMGGGSTHEFAQH